MTALLGAQWGEKVESQYPKSPDHLAFSHQDIFYVSEYSDVMCDFL